MASVNQMSVLADQDMFPEDFDMDQPLFDDYSDIENLPSLEQNYSRSMFPILRKDINATVSSNMACTNVDEEAAAFVDLDVPDISRDMQLPMYETGVDATIVSWIQDVSVVNAHSTQSVGSTPSNPATSSV